MGFLEVPYIQIAGVSIYKSTCRISNTADGKDIVTGKTLKSYTYTFDFREKDPELYYAAVSTSGNKLSPGSTVSMDLTKYNSNDPLLAENTNSDLLIRLRTDSIPGSGSTGSLRMRLKYVDDKGDEKISKYYIVKQEVLNYYGYWPSQTDNQSNFAYLHGMSEGNYVEFPVGLQNAGAVVSVELSMDNYSNDEWQTSGMYVGMVSKIGKRRIYQQTASVGDVKSDYRIVRSNETTEIPPFPLGMQMLLNPGRTYKIILSSATVDPSADTVDYESVRYSLSYEQTKLDFGYVKTVKTFDIVVKVAVDPTANNINGDSGSQNHFFFQLRFKNGSSAFVLANQQLSADGFRAGCEESFSISVNRDYNDLTSVRIIPEDNTSDSKEFDKLNIEWITVTERAYGGTCMQYVINNVGWIGIDYRDEAEGSSIVGSPGRSVADIAKTYSVSYRQDVANLFCEVEALAWIVDDPDFDMNSSSRFSASLSADIDYIDYDDQPQTMSFDVISRMYDYMNKAPVSYEAKSDGSNQALFDNMGTVSDPDWMLRPNHRDRFSLPPLPNAKTITSITFRGTNRSTGMAQWVIGGVSLYTVITDSGVISLTADKEYYRKMELEPLCLMELEDSSEKYLQLVLPSGISEPVTVSLLYNELPRLTSGGWTPAVTKIPESTKDSLNIYVYPDSKSRDIASDTNEVAVGAAIQYSLPFSKVMQVKQNPLRTYGSGTGDAVFFYNGLSAENMQGLKKLSISCRDSKILFDHAIVQQVKDDVIVNTYTMKLSHASAVLGLSVTPERVSTVYDQKKQKIMLSFSAGTKSTTLFGSSGEKTDIRDIAIAFRYKSSLDKGLTNKPEYYTPYVYLTEVGIDRITPGMMAEIPMEIPYVDEITGYRIVSYGGIEASVEAAMIVNSSFEKKEKDTATGEYKYLGEKVEEYYSFGETYTLNNEVSRHNSVRKGMSGKGTVNPVDIIITTDPEKTDGMTQDTNVVMTLNYKSGTSTKTKVILDARKYIQNEVQQFVTYSEPDDTGQRKMLSNTARLRFFLVECDELISAEIMLTDDTNAAVWYVSSIEGSVNCGEIELQKKSDLVFNSIKQTLNFEKVTLRTYVSTDDELMKFVANHETTIVAQGGRRLDDLGGGRHTGGDVLIR